MESRAGRLIAGLSAVVVATSACANSAPPRSQRSVEPTPTTSPSSEVAQPSSVLLGTRDVVFRLKDGATRRVTEVPGFGLVFAPDGKRFAYVVRKGNRHLVTTGSLGKHGRVVVEKGTDPMWSPDGRFLAAVAPAPGYTICKVAPSSPEEKPRGCFEGERVIVYDTKDRRSQPKVALGGDDWDIVGWTSGPRVLAASYRESLALAAPGASFNEREDIPYIPHEVWGISPSDPVVLIHASVGTELVRLDDGARTKVEIGDATLGPGAWSPDGSTIVVVSSSGKRRSLLVIEASSGAFGELPGSEGALGSVVWSSDSSWFAYLRNERSPRVVVCDRSLECEERGAAPPNARLLALV